MWLCGLLLAWVPQSCIMDDTSDCGFDVQFKYDYNILETDVFGQEADWVSLWVYDSDDRLVEIYTEEGIRGREGYTMHIPHLAAGDYTLVAWAGSFDVEGEFADFEFAETGHGSGIETLTARLPRTEDSTHQARLNSLLNGVLEVSVADGQRFTIDMMKIIHTLRVILMPTRGGQEMAVEDFEIFIDDTSSWLWYDASVYREDRVTYRPYYMEVSSASEPGSKSEAISSAVVAELNTSRLIYEAEPRLVVRNSASGADIMDIDLAWFLSLQAIGEHRAEWSNQEYLDRQDEYALTFFIDMDTGTWMRGRIVVNGWVISLEDVEL